MLGIIGKWITTFSLMVPLPVIAQPQNSSPWPKQEFAVTEHTARIAGRNMRYTARAGTIPLYDHDTGELVARIFVVAYLAEHRPGTKPRPLTFIWNGGPGANASSLHFVGFGPKGLETPATYPDWADAPPSRLADRETSWLQHSDLVFVDPLGTGYSRVIRERDKDVLYTTHGDAETVAEAIRLYRLRFDGWDAPVFLAGESFGTTRAMHVAEALERRRVRLAGVILISGSYDAGQNVPLSLATAMQLPMFTGTAHYHQKLAADLQARPQLEVVAEATKWARDVYAPALERREQLSKVAIEQLAEGIGRYSGLPTSAIDRGVLAVSATQFADLLLADRRLSLGHYDARVTGPARPPGTIWMPMQDPSIQPMLDLMQGTSPVVNRYLRDTLGYRSDLLYRGPFGEGWHPQPMEDVTQGATGPLGGIFTDWMTMQFNRPRTGGGEGSPLPAAPAARAVMPPLARAMTRNPDLLVWNVKGMYDGSCAGQDVAVEYSAPGLRERVRNGCYAAGHMVYTDPSTRQQLAEDFGRFVRAALDRRSPGGQGQ